MRKVRKGEHRTLEFRNDIIRKKIPLFLKTLETAHRKPPFSQTIHSEKKETENQNPSFILRFKWHKMIIYLFFFSRGVKAVTGVAWWSIFVLLKAQD